MKGLPLSRVVPRLREYVGFDESLSSMNFMFLKENALKLNSDLDVLSIPLHSLNGIMSAASHVNSSLSFLSDIRPRGRASTLLSRMAAQKLRMSEVLVFLRKTL